MMTSPSDPTPQLPTGAISRSRVLAGRVALSAFRGAVAAVAAALDFLRRHQAGRAWESEARLRRVIDEAPLPIMVHAEDGEVLQLNRAWTEASGYTREEIPTVAAWIERAYGTAAERACKAIREALDLVQGHYEGGEYMVRVADGSERPWLFRAAPVGRDSKGRRLLVAMALDVTELRRAEAAEAESEARLRAVVDIADDPIIVTDERGMVQSFNHAGELLFGYRAGDVIGRSVATLMTEAQPQEQDGARAVEARRCDGSVFPVHRTVAQWTLGGRRFSTAILHDLTEQKRRDAAMRDAADLQAAILDALPEHVTLLDADGTILAVNKGWRRFGAANGLSRPKDGVGDNYLAACDQAAAAGVGEDAQIGATLGTALRAVLAGERNHFAIDYSCHAPEEQRWFRCIAAPATHGGRRGAVVIHVDITEAKRREDALRQAQKLDAIGQLTSGIAHDFNNYLTVIAGNLERMRGVCADMPKVARMVAQSEAAAARAENLVKQLLAFSRKQALRPESLDCNAVVSEMQDLLRRPLPAGVDLNIALATELWRTCADRNQLETALLNLVVNARDAMPKSGGQITVRTANVRLGAAAALANDLLAGDYVEVSVADTGSGMTQAVLAQVFEPFYTTKARGKGSGLGLSQVYGFAKRSEGSAAIDTREGAGTTVRLLLPRERTETTALV